MQEILRRAVQIADESRAAMARTAVTPRPIRSLAADVDEAHTLAERTRRPVDFQHGGARGTIWPTGMTPPS
jgi:hypothetical protein